MTDHDNDDELEGFFRAARDTETPPPQRLVAAILRDGLAAQSPVIHAPRAARETRRARRIWPQATALAACLLAGLVAGLIGPGLFESQQSTDPAGDILAFYDLAVETDG